MATATKMSTTVRISEKTHHSLRALAEQSGESMQAVLDRAIEQYRRQQFLQECHAAYATLQADPEAWEDYRKELAAWDVTLMDGLDAHEAWPEAADTAGGDACG